MSDSPEKDAGRPLRSRREIVLGSLFLTAAGVTAARMDLTCPPCSSPPNRPAPASGVNTPLPETGIRSRAGAPDQARRDRR